MKKIVFLGLPRLGQVEPESYIAAFNNAVSEDSEFNVLASPHQTSLLANGFNQLYCKFLNGMFPYFALLHADVNPEPGWLENLILQMEAAKASVIHAVVAIKDMRGLTSTAVGSPGDPWEARRLTVSELQSLPPVFDINDILKTLGPPWLPNPCLLPNTGCMVIKRDLWCMDFPGFCITDKIERNAVTFEAKVEPEDWAFGRWCARNKVRVVGSRAVKTEHIGRASFPTGHLWGNWHVDEHFLGRHGFNYNGGSAASAQDPFAAARDSTTIRLTPAASGSGD